MSAPGPNNLNFEKLVGLESQVPLYDYSSVQLVDGVRLDIYFGTHTCKRDLGQEGVFRAILNDVDIFLPERAGWNNEYLRVYNKVSKGDAKFLQREKERVQLPDEESHPEFHVALLSALYNARPAVGFVDIPEKYPLVKRIKKSIVLMPAPAPSFEEDLDRTRIWLNEYDAQHMMRENYMLNRFGPTVEGLIQANPKLANKKDTSGISVVMLAGATHTGIYDGFEHVRQQTVAEHPDFKFECTPHYGFDDQLFSYSEQAQGRHIRNIELDDTLLAKFILLEELVARERGKEEGQTSNELAQSIMPTLDAMSIDELKDLWSSLKMAA